MSLTELVEDILVIYLIWMLVSPFLIFGVFAIVWKLTK